MMINLRTCVDRLYEIAERIDKQDLIQVAKFLRQRIYQPDGYVVFLGESCSGKSTIINSMIGQGILPVSSVPSTGAITEVFLNQSQSDPIYAVINRDATMEILDYRAFCNLAVSPDPNVARLRATLFSENMDMSGVRLFDTPGYGSLIAEHDEVLMDFLPNCDAVIYTVSYRVGIQAEDHEFLRKLKELSRPGIPIYLLINRCPIGVSASDARVREIKRNAAALLTNQELPLFLIPSLQTQGGIVHSTIVDQLRDQVIHDLNSKERKNELYTAFVNYLQDLALLCRAELERQIREIEMSEEQAKGLKDKFENLSCEFKNAIEKIVKPGFQKIQSQLPKYISASRKKIETSVCAEIDRQSAASKEEMIAYTNTHLLPYHARLEAEEIQSYIEVELTILDEQVQNYLNSAVIKFERDIELHYSSATIKAGAGFAKGTAGKLLNAGLLKYFAKYGGNGGAAAGIANAASHGLKQLGDIFGKTFSRETHNALKHAIKKIGLTSTKALGLATAGLVELASIGIEYATWKHTLIAKVKKGLGRWENDILSLIQQDLKKLEQVNIDTITEISETYAAAYKVDDCPTGDLSTLTGLLEDLTKLEEEIA